jgi:uncharacterized protein with ParB-like and HNH nuclease domain
VAFDDGQQRMTTLMLLLLALRQYLKERDWQAGEDSPTAKRIDAYFLKNPTRRRRASVQAS